MAATPSVRPTEILGAIRPTRLGPDRSRGRCLRPPSLSRPTVAEPGAVAVPDADLGSDAVETIGYPLRAKEPLMEPR